MASAVEHEVAAMLARADVATAELGRPAVDEHPLDLGVDDLLTAFGTGALTPASVVEAALGRIARLDPGVGAIWAVDAGAALAAAERSAARWRAGTARPLEGVPIVVKDLLDTSDLPTTGGSRWLDGRRPAHDADVVAAVRAAGAVVLAKTATFELGCGDEQTPFGVVHNPHDPRCTTGGSSAGSAAALAAGYAPLALGTDTGGSIRIPSAHCGVVGLKPTLGRLSCRGLVGLAPTLDSPGPMARTVADVSRLLAALDATTDPVAPMPRVVGIARRWFTDVMAGDVRARFESVVDALPALGVQVRTIDVPFAEHGATLSWLITMYEAAQTYAGAPREQLTAAFVARLEAGDLIDREHYESALLARSRLTAAVSGVFDGCDLLVLPANLSTAPPLDQLDRLVDGHAVTWPDVTARTMAMWNVTGLPAVVVPVGTGADGLPVGVQIVGPAHADERCLALAQAVERSAVNAM